MQQYPTPNFYGYQPQQFNPYMQRMENLQQYQTMQSPLQSNVSTQMPGTAFNPFGKIVESVDVVKVTDIPMDGNLYFFPQADGQAIYGKKFLANGQTQILTYKPVFEDNTSISSNESKKTKFDALEHFTEVFQDKIADINDKMDKIEKYLKPTKTKKEVDTDA